MGTLESLKRLAKGNTIYVTDIEGELLKTLATHSRAERILEIGRHSSVSTWWLNQGIAVREIHSLEPKPRPEADRVLKGVANCDLQFHHPTTFRQAVEAKPSPCFAAYDLIYIDGDHSYEGCLADLKLAYMVSRTVTQAPTRPTLIVIHDIHSPKHGKAIAAACNEFSKDAAYLNPGRPEAQWVDLPIVGGKLEDGMRLLTFL